MADCWPSRLVLAVVWRRRLAVCMIEGEEEQDGERTRAAMGLKLRWNWYWCAEISVVV